jgi:hypothetical protein
MPSRPISAKKAAKTTNKLRKAEAKSSAAQRVIDSGKGKSSGISGWHGFKSSTGEYSVAKKRDVRKEVRAEKKSAKATTKLAGIRAAVIEKKNAGSKTPKTAMNMRIGSSKSAATGKSVSAGLSDKKIAKVYNKAKSATAKKISGKK